MRKTFSTLTLMSLLVMCLLGGRLAFADSSFNFSFQSYGSARTQTIYGYGHQGDVSWGFSLSQTRLKFDQPVGTTKNALTDVQNFISGGVNYHFPNSKWTLGLGLDYGKSPEENLSFFGPSLKAEYRHDEAWHFDLEVGSLNYVINFSDPSRTTKVVKPVSGSTDVHQSSFRLGAKWKLDEAIGFYAAYTKYAYSRPINDFVRYLDSYDGSSNLLSGLQNELSAFNDNSFLFKTFLDIDKYDITYTLLRAVSATNSVSTLFHIVEIAYPINSYFKFAGGAGLSTTDAQDSVRATSTSFYFLGGSAGF